MISIKKANHLSSVSRARMQHLQSFAPRPVKFRRPPEGAALRIRFLLHHRGRLEEMGTRARDFVRDNFLLTRHLREYLTVMLSLANEGKDRIELS